MIRRLNIWKRALALLLAAVLCSAAGCGGEQSAGADWRTTGIAAAGGRLVRNGNGMDVLVVVGADSAALYLDQETQELVDSIPYSMSFPDAETAFSAVSFDDLNGDGNSDVTILFLHSDGSSTELIWLWDPAGYIFQPELSSVTPPETDS